MPTVGWNSSTVPGRALQRCFVTWKGSSWPSAPSKRAVTPRPMTLSAKLTTGPSSGIESTYLDTETSRGLFDDAVGALRKFVGDDSPAAGDGGHQDTEFCAQLEHLLGDRSPVKVWLAALLLKRIKLFEESFKSYHFTRNAQQVR